MSNINAQLLSDLYAAFSAKFNAGMQRGRTPPVDGALLKYHARYAEIGMDVPSTTGEEVHLWLSQVPGFIEWAGDRIVHTLTHSGLRVRNKDWAQTVKVLRNDIEDDRIGGYGILFEALGAEASRDAFWLDLLIETLTDPPVWADGNPFFDNDRVYGAQSIDNFVGSALSRSVFKTAVSLMLGYKGSNGKPLHVSPYMLLCGSTVFWTAKELMESEDIIESGVATTNDVRGMCVPRFHSGLEADEWYLLGMQASYKPLAAQIRKEGNALDRKDSPSDDNVFWNKEYVYGADARGAGFLPFPHLVIRGYKSGTSGAPKAAEAPKAKGKAS